MQKFGGRGISGRSAHSFLRDVNQIGYYRHFNSHWLTELECVNSALIDKEVLKSLSKYLRGITTVKGLADSLDECSKRISIARQIRAGRVKAPEPKKETVVILGTFINEKRMKVSSIVVDHE